MGKPVGKIKATDEDLGINADVKYSIMNSEGANTFSIATDRDTREGVISLKKVAAAQQPHPPATLPPHPRCPPPVLLLLFLSSSSSSFLISDN